MNRISEKPRHRSIRARITAVIEWLLRVDPNRPFLTADGKTWTYGETEAEVRSRLTDEPQVILPKLDAASVFDVIAAVIGGGATVIREGIEFRGSPGAALVVFTSGTTWRPRGVRLTRANLEAAASASAEHLGHGPDDNWLLAMPLHHVGGLSILVRQIFTGGSVRLLAGFEPRSFAAALRGGVTMASVVPTMLRRILGHGPFEALRAVLVGGGPIPEGLLDQAAAVGLPVLPTYGMTETFGQVATLRPGSPLERKAHPLPGVEFRIEPDGRIAVRGAQVSPGYVGEPDRDNPWFVTSDLGTLDNEGALRILGRADTVIVTGGENVNPEAVEDVIRQHPGVEEVVVTGLPDDEWGRIVACVYEGDAGDLTDWVSARLPGFMVPKRWVRVDALPKTAIGKPDRVAALRALRDGD
jgi:o-succinylbenzoate---CoA ligase